MSHGVTVSASRQSAIHSSGYRQWRLAA